MASFKKTLFRLMLFSVLFTCTASPAWSTPSERAEEGEVSFLPPVHVRFGEGEGKIPFQIEAGEEDGLLRGKVTGTLGEPFESVAEALTNPASWCEFLPLSFNIKACTYQTEGASKRLEIYAGRKAFQDLEKTHQMAYSFRVTESTENRFSVLLESPRGPLGTRDYQIELTGDKVPEGTSLTFTVCYRTSLLSRVLTRGYLATAGKDKKGFSVVARTEKGEPVFSGGMRGVIERNAMRYYFGLQALLATRDVSPSQRFMARANAWFSLTERHFQLWEMDRREYIENKKREWDNQRRLQVDRLASAASAGR